MGPGLGENAVCAHRCSRQLRQHDWRFVWRDKHTPTICWRPAWLGLCNDGSTLSLTHRHRHQKAHINLCMQASFENPMRGFIHIKQHCSSGLAEARNRGELWRFTPTPWCSHCMTSLEACSSAALQYFDSIWVKHTHLHSSKPARKIGKQTSGCAGGSWRQRSERR